MQIDTEKFPKFWKSSLIGISVKLVSGTVAVDVYNWN